MPLLNFLYRILHETYGCGFKCRPPKKIMSVVAPFSGWFDVISHELETKGILGHDQKKLSVRSYIYDIVLI